MPEAATAAYTGVLISRLVKDGSGGDSGYTYAAMHPDFILAATYQGSTATFGAARTAATFILGAGSQMLGSELSFN